MERKTKLRFVGSEEALSHLQLNASFRQLLGHQPARSRAFSTVFFDTKSFALREAGLAWYACDDGSNSVQTIATVGDLVPVETGRARFGSRPKLSHISDRALRRRVSALAGPDKLDAVASFGGRRVSVVLAPRPNAKIKAVFETGQLAAGSGNLPIADLELELLQGEEATLIECARTFVEAVPLLPAVQSNAEQGYAVALGATNAPNRPPLLTLPTDLSADDALGRIIGHCLRHLLGNLSAVTVARDPEGVHQMRVALRRLRSGLNLYGGSIRKAFEPIEEEVRWLAGVLGQVRDLDVFISDALAPALTAHGDDTRLQDLMRLAHARQQAASTDLLEALASVRFRSLMFELAAATVWHPWRAAKAGKGQKPLGARRFARDRLARRRARVLKFGKRIGELESGQRHRLRIKLKKLRYAVEFFSALLPKRRTAQLLARLSELQDVLGGLNDATVARALTAELVSQRQNPGDPASAYASGVVIGWRLGHARADTHELERRWRRFAKTQWI